MERSKPTRMTVVSDEVNGSDQPLDSESSPKLRAMATERHVFESVRRALCAWSVTGVPSQVKRCARAPAQAGSTLDAVGQRRCSPTMTSAAPLTDEGYGLRCGARTQASSHR